MRNLFFLSLILLFSQVGFSLVEGASEGTDFSPSDLRWGVEGQGIGLLSRVDYSDDSSSGFGWGLGVHLEKEMTSVVHGILGLGYQKMQLGRNLNSSGSIHDPGSEFQQSQKGVFGRALLRYFFRNYFKENDKIHGLSWEFGGEYFHTLSAKQTNYLGSSIEIPTSKFLFFQTGPSLHFNSGKETLFSLSSHVFVNLIGESRFKLMGVRLALAIDFPM